LIWQFGGLEKPVTFLANIEIDLESVPVFAVFFLITYLPSLGLPADSYRRYVYQGIRQKAIAFMEVHRACTLLWPDRDWRHIVRLFHYE